VFVHSLSLSLSLLRWYLEIGHDHFFTNPYLFTVHITFLFNYILCNVIQHNLPYVSFQEVFLPNLKIPAIYATYHIHAEGLHVITVQYCVMSVNFGFLIKLKFCITFPMSLPTDA